MNDAFLSALGLCKKAGKAVYGFETVKGAIMRSEAFLVFSACDLSSKTEKELCFLCENWGVQIIKTQYEMKILGGSIGKLTGIIAVTDEGFATMLKQKLRNSL